MKMLVTGTSGFVGRAVWQRLNAMCGVQAVGSVRRATAFTNTGALVVAVGDLSAQTDWSEALAGVEAVVHTAARVHVMDDTAADPLTEFRRVNVEGTLNLARQAVATGVKRFVFLSSIKVNGEATPAPPPSTSSGQAEPLPKRARQKEREKFSADDVPAPQDPYGVSKMEAEQGLRHAAHQLGGGQVLSVTD